MSLSSPSDTQSESNEIQVRVSSSDFSREVVEEAVYWLTSDYFVGLAADGNDIVVSFRRKEGKLLIGDPEGEFRNYLVESSLRLRLKKETEPLRNLILAYTFQHFLKNRELKNS